MTINLADNSPRISYAVAQGVTQTSFAVPFEFFANADLNVYVDGTLKTLTTHYTVSGGDGSTGTVTISVTGATGGSTVVITRDVALERTTDFPSSGPFQIGALNTELDRLTAIAADLDDKAGRALQLTDFDVAASLVLPTVDNRKGKTLAFNAASGAVEAGPTISDVQTVSAAAADIQTLAHIEDGTDATNTIQTVASISSNVSTVAGVSSAVSTVAGISSNVTAVAGDASDIGTVSANISNVNTVAGISANVTTVAGNTTNINTVAGDQTDIGTVATNIADINTAANNITEIQNASTNAATATTKASEAATSATNAATSATTATTKASEASTSASNASTSETNAATSETNAATSASAAAASQTAAAASAASAATAYDSFDDRYLGTKASDPTLDNDGNALVSGALYFSSSENIMKVYDGSSWIAATSAGNVSLTTYQYTATGGQTTFSGSDDNAATLTYTVNNILVTLNGSLLFNGTDYTATNGTSIVLSSGATASDVLQITAFASFTTADMVPASTGGTFSGNVAMTADLTVDTNTLHVDSTNNRVGIGTSLPNSPLEVSNGTENHRVALGTGEVYLMARNASSYITQEYIANQHVFTGYGDNSSNEAMRLDASGNLLAGTTNVNIRDSSTNDGLVYRTGNSLDVTNNGNTVAIFNRNTSDGNILTFRKGAVDMGSIGVTAGDNLYVSSTATDHAGLVFNNTAVGPWVNNAASDNTMVLGTSVNRFKDLYLSGGVYLGGVGSANKLDDYEEGTWTPAPTVGSASSASGNYTKIGRLVYVTGYIGGFSNTTNNENLNLSGLPFTAGVTSNAVGSAMWSLTDKDFGYEVVYITGTSQLRFYHTTNGAFDNIRHIDLDSSSSEVYFNATYMAT